MKFLFLRSQLVDVEFAGGGGCDFGDVEFGFDVSFGDRLDARSRSGWSGGARFWDTGSGTGRSRSRCRRFGSDAADGFRDFFFERAARAGLQRQGGETRENFESRGERSRCSLGAKHGRESVGGLAAGASRDDVVDGLLELVASALNALEVVPQSARDGLFDRVGFGCHTCLLGVLPDFLPFCHCGGWRRERQPFGGGGVTKRVMRSWVVGDTGQQ